MRGTNGMNLMKGLVILMVVFAWLTSFEWFQTLVRNLLLGSVVLVALLVVWAGYRLYRRFQGG